MTDLTTLINDDSADVKIRVNALVKRASLFIQQCKDPTQDPELSFGDFAQAIELDPENADIYHHRGQVHLLIDEINKVCEKITPKSPYYSAYSSMSPRY